ncbi:MAG: DUF4317 domain-containing protein [Oscillospiraceae bacterium]|nr:DUF4317 domain-containing protein [Oscillospiraceae bacterium]
MNKKELAEIKNNFTDTSGFFTLNRVITAYIDPQKNVRCKTNRIYSLIPEEEGSVLMESLRKIFKGNLGKNLLEYPFPNAEYKENGAQKILYEAMYSKLTDESTTDKLIVRIMNNLAYEMAYTLIIGHCSYSIISKDRNDEMFDNAADEYNFIVAAICPANTSDDGLIFDSETNTIVKKSNTDPIISREPTDGFFFPIFNERAPDVNSVMYFTKSPKKPNISCIDNVLGCKFFMSAHVEKATFQTILNDVVGDELNYTVITQVNEKLRELVENSKNETDLPVLDVNKMYTILFDSGVSNEKLEALPDIYKNKVGNGAFTATNLVENKTTLSTSEITVNINKDATDKVRTTVVDGRRCLIIDLDDSTIWINGMTTYIMGNSM